MNDTLLDINSLYANYGKLQVLHDINWQVKYRERELLIGPNGAGKSTLLKSICGLHQEIWGDIYYKNKDITNLSIQNRVDNGIVYLRQDRDIFPGLSVKENIEMGGFYLSSDQFEQRLENILEYFSILKDLLDTKAGLLSGGERRSLGIAMVLIKQPKLLLLDEPTAGLAPATAKKILYKIFELLNHSNTTMIVVEHKLSLILDIVASVNVMVNGRIVEKDLFPQKIKESPEVLDEYYFE